MSTKKVRVSRSPEMASKRLKDALLRWVCERHATNRPFDRDHLRNKTLALAGEFGLKDFKCTNVWLTIFLKSNGISSNLDECGGPSFADYRKWVETMRPLITRYRYKNLFHLDELVVCPEVAPAQVPESLDFARAKSSAVRQTSATNWMTVLLCCNATGTEKLPVLISGQYRATLERDDLRYVHHPRSWITGQLFENWLMRLDRRMTRARRRILLLLHGNRMRALRNLKLEHVDLIFLPKRYPPKLRPLKRDVFRYVKMIYRRNYVDRIVRRNEPPWNLERIVENVVAAWNAVPKDLIVCSFQRTRFRSDDDFLAIDYPGWSDLGSGISFRRFVTFDDDLSNSSGPDDQFVARGNHSYNLRGLERAIRRMEIEVCDEDRDETNGEGDFALSTRPEDASGSVGESRGVGKGDSRVTVVTDQSVIEEANGSRASSVEYCDISKDSYPENDAFCGRVDADDVVHTARIVDDVILSMIGSISESESSAWTEVKSDRDGEGEEDAKVDNGSLEEVIRVKMTESYEDTLNDEIEEGDIDCRNVDGRIDESQAQATEKIATIACGDQETPSVGTDDDDVEGGNLKGSTNVEGSSIDDEQLLPIHVKRKHFGSNDKNDAEDDKDSQEEPREKKPKRDENWSRYYETNFAFGSNSVDAMSISPNEEIVEEQRCEMAMTSQTKGSGIEERRVVTIGTSSSSYDCFPKK